MNEVSNKIETDDPNKNNTSNQMNRYSIEHPQGISYLWLNYINNDNYFIFEVESSFKIDKTLIRASK